MRPQKPTAKSDIKNVIDRLLYITFQNARGYANWYYDYRHDIVGNGEGWLISKLLLLKCPVVFDVGANRGEWSKLALDSRRDIDLHAFELSRETFEVLRQNEHIVGARLNNFGLSDQSGDVEFRDYGTASGANTLIVNSGGEHWTGHRISRSRVETGEFYCEREGIKKIGFLKIDVEGAESLVLKGFSSLLEQQAIEMVQFEYGPTSGDLHFLMRDFYRFFENVGYQVGKLRTNRVEFRAWDYDLNEFRSGPNFVAIRKSDKSLKEALE